MSLKTKLVSTISAICMVLALLTVGVWAVSTASVTLGGSVSFAADNVHARITGSVSGTQETITLPNLEYDVNTDVNSTDFQSKLSSWANNDMTFTSENLITMTITVENLSEERSLFVTLTDNTTTDNVGKTLKQGASNYTSATAVEVAAGNTTTFTMTLSVTDKNESASATVSYQVDLRDANAEETIKVTQLDESKYAKGITYSLDDTTMIAAITSYDESCNDNVVIPGYVSYGGKTYNVESVTAKVYYDDNYGYDYATSPFVNATNITIEEGVKNIGKYAFVSGNDENGFSGNIASITLPTTLVSIGTYAFLNCSGLTSIEIPSGVTSIGSSAFRGCSGLTSVTIGSGVTSIGSSAFRGCSGLTSIIVDENNTIYDSRDNCNAIIETASNTLIHGFSNTVIPDSVTSIGNSAFYHCTGLTSIEIPDSVTSIGSTAFSGCTGLTSVTIGSGVTSIGNSAFNYCNKLTTITIDSETIASGLTSKTSQGYLINYATTIYVKTEIVTAGSVGSYVTNTTNFPNVETITSGDYVGYTKYSK